jgi:hypothetical protein
VDAAGDAHVDDGVPPKRCPPVELERDVARWSSHLQHAARRNALERGREKHLQTTTELESLRVDTVRNSIHVR